MRLKEFREKAGLTQKELGLKLGVSDSAVNQWETGKVKPRADKLLKLSEILNCTVDELLGVAQ